jgi:uncharacterized protein (TIGR02001 family)
MLAPSYRKSPDNPAHNKRPRNVIIRIIMRIWITTSRYLIGTLCLTVAAGALAQISGSIAGVSDYRYRGRSLSSGAPAVQATLNYDHTAGWYVGGFVSTIKIHDSNASQHWMTYAGYAQRLDSGWSWDVGTTKLFFPQISTLTSTEVYAGLSLGNVNGKFYYSPNYIGENAHSIYAELNSGHPLSESLSLIEHLGFLRSYQFRNGASASTRTDVRLGIGYSLQSWSCQLAWVMVRHPSSSPDKLVFSNTYTF